MHATVITLLVLRLLAAFCQEIKSHLSVKDTKHFYFRSKQEPQQTFSSAACNISVLSMKFTFQAERVSRNIFHDWRMVCISLMERFVPSGSASSGGLIEPSCDVWEHFLIENFSNRRPHTLARASACHVMWRASNLLRIRDLHSEN